MVFFSSAVIPLVLAIQTSIHYSHAPSILHVNERTVAPVAQSVTSKPSEGLDVGLDMNEVTRSEISFHTIPNNGGERPCRGCTKLDCMVDEGKGPLNPSRGKGKASPPQKEGDVPERSEQKTHADFTPV